MPHQSFLCPKPLRPGDAVAVVAPSGVVEPSHFEMGVKFLQRRYAVRWTPKIFSQAGYLAGSDERRFEELQQAIDGDDIKAIFAARGGYGAMRLLPKLQLEGRKPKWMVGFSDITALHALWQRAGWQSLHGPVVTQMRALHADTLQAMVNALEKSNNGSLLGTRCLVPGTAVGPLLGGNLSVLSRLVGTPYMPDMRGAILLLEDVGEAPYRIDRMWTHLRLAGVFENLVGIVGGEFWGGEEPSEEKACAEVLESLVAEVGVPCVAGFPIGHGTRNAAVRLGSRARLSAGSLRLVCLHSEEE